jgi:hypothetical protein
MADYNKMYSTLSNAMTDAINILQKAQQKTEEMYIDHDPTPIKLVNPDGNENGGDDDA